MGHSVSNQTTTVKQSMLSCPSVQNRFDRSLFIVEAYLHDNGQRQYLLDLIKVIATFFTGSDNWYSKVKGKHMKILDEPNNTKVVKDPVNGFECVFGTDIISEGINCWKIRVNRLFTDYDINSLYHLFIGVFDDTKGDMKEMSHRDIASDKTKIGGYIYEVTYGHIFKAGAGGLNVNRFETKVSKNGDIVDLTLNLDNKTIDCKINDKDIERTMKDIKDGEYRLCVCMYYGDTELELL